MKRFWLASLFMLIAASAAFAHGSEGGFILLLPSRFYILGAAIAVAASFLLLALLPKHLAEAMLRSGIRTIRLPHRASIGFSLFSLVFLVFILATGVLGTRDPLENPLPLFIWVDWWIAFTLLQAVTGELWGLFNPWSGLLRLMRTWSGGLLPDDGFLPLPQAIGYAIAIVQFFGFAWYELVDLAPYDPDRLAFAVAMFWLLNLVGMMVFGERSWRERAEPFSIYFSLIGSVAPLQSVKSQESGQSALHLVWPGASLAKREPMSVSGSLFVLLTLATISFDGFSHTFYWISFIGLNPLEFVGRSAVVWQSTIGIIGSFAVLSAIFFGCVWAGLKLAASEVSLADAAGRLVYSIVPISLAFHAAHYLTYLMVEGQYSAIAASDPFSLGWNLFGTANWQVTTSFFFDYESVRSIWNIQTAAIVIGHIIGILTAHLIAIQLFKDNAKAIRSQMALAIFMVFYTAFGLWLLSIPSAG